MNSKNTTKSICENSPISGQINRFDNYMKLTLGSDYYTMTEAFFMSVWTSPVPYKVFLVRRCFNLMYSFYKVKQVTLGKNNPLLNPQVEGTFYTDSSILACAEDIADYYIKWRCFPDILIVDDILIHGRTLNRLIDNLIDAVCGILRKKDAETEQVFIVEKFLDSIKLNVMVRNSKPLLLRSKYFQCLMQKPDKSDVWKPREWHELSSRISLLVGEGCFYNTSFVLSLYEKQLDEENTNNQLHKKFQDAAQRLSSVGFREYSWNKRTSYSAWVRPLENSNGNIMAFYTVRISQNNFDNSYRIIPFVIMSDFHLPSDEETFPEFFPLRELLDILPNRSGCERMRAEALYLLLSHNLLLLFQNEIGERVVLKKNLDVDKIQYSFKFESEAKGNSFIDKVISLESPLFSWDKMDALILKATGHSTPLFEKSAAGSRIDSDVNGCDYDLLIEDIIAGDGLRIEEAAYKEYSNLTRTSSTSKKKPILEMFGRIGENCKAALHETIDDYIKAIGVLFRLMDIGAAAIAAEETAPYMVSCAYRAGEQSHFIYPKRYYKQIPVLIAMERDCFYDRDNILERIGNFYSDDPALAEQLKDFVSFLYGSGQRISDWNINLIKWIEIDGNTSEENRNEAMQKEVFSYIKERFKSMDKYNSAYNQL